MKKMGIARISAARQEAWRKTEGKIDAEEQFSCVAVAAAEGDCWMEEES